MIDTQMLKGLIDGIILHIIKNKETYGYEIIEELKLNGFYNMTEGTVYPILTRLIKKGLILGTLKESTKGPRRKYYYITDAGRKYLDEFYTGYDSLKAAMDSVLEKGNK
ncbi:PadR family transcriptional regulator [uncultured Anaerococcus sp.]|uniref:PadR family transcriptional regulator n=1 Tax=uncultured Anaerococcus sp. TaxID=293428 RepID=UPI00263A3B0F|nr:PadR family transcriptional regulator [uncultured Anaerococcus sp.]